MEDNTATATSQVLSRLDRLRELSRMTEEFGGYNAEISEEIVQIVADLEARVTLLETAALDLSRPRPVWSGWFPT